MIMAIFASVRMGAMDTIARRAVIRLLMETNLFAEHQKRPGNHVEYNSFSRTKPNVVSYKDYYNQYQLHIYMQITLTNDIKSK